jgi:rfaE bifunctional protein nucleotidyltransferase chain/domain
MSGSKPNSDAPQPRAGVISIRQLARWADRARRAGVKIVATNGCFDLIHFGHVQYLQRARALGDVLVVGLNSDKSVRQLKGPTRPLMNERHRAGLLAALACVDAVVVFPDKRAVAFLKAVKPDVYVKGGDYRVGTLDPDERAVLEQAGSRIRFIPFVKGCSTTALVEKIKRLPRSP